MLSFATAMGCAGAQSAPGSLPPAAPPKLVLLIVVDQLRGDMLDRYRADLSKGYARLMTGGAWFTNGFQDHAITETAPGHASTMSGRFPAHTGIVTNTAGVGDRDFPLLLGRELGASPDRFIGTTLKDWLTAKDPRTRAFSVSRKDRGAILPIGKSKQQVYWYSTSAGAFTTSNYYRDSLPGWVVAFNARRIPQSYAGKAWELSRPAASYSEPDSVVNEANGRDFVFPHVFPTDTARAQGAFFIATPSMDSLEALFALEGLNQLGIGRGPQTDVMSVSFSTTDAVGHAYGPDSREAHENEIRLDQTIGWFLDSLFKLRDPNSVVIALTGDHGSSPIPELARARGQATGEQGLRVPGLRPIVDSVSRYVASKGGDTTAMLWNGDYFAVDHLLMKAKGVNPDSVVNLFRRLALRVPGVARVDRVSDLRKANLDRDPIARRWVHQIPEDELADLTVTLTRYSYWGGSAVVSTHGSPYDQDASVPIIFYGPWVKPGRYDTFARTVDIGVTLGAIAGVKPTEKVDGVVLKGAIK